MAVPEVCEAAGACVRLLQDRGYDLASIDIRNDDVIEGHRGGVLGISVRLVDVGSSQLIVYRRDIQIDGARDRHRGVFTTVGNVDRNRRVLGHTPSPA